MEVRTRLSQHRFHLLNDETKKRIKELASRYAMDMLYDYQFECFEVTWNECNWLLVSLMEPEIFGPWAAERIV
jgi:hypothetical protein